MWSRTDEAVRSCSSYILCSLLVKTQMFTATNNSDFAELLLHVAVYTTDENVCIGTLSLKDKVANQVHTFIVRSINLLSH